MNKKIKTGFTLIELTVVIAIISLILTASFISFNNARQKARNAKRLSDITQIQNTLGLYLRDEGKYPDSLTFGSQLTGSSSNRVYMSILPQNPGPRNDGACPDNNYSYQTVATGTSYKIDFCLSEATGQLSAGEKCATPNGIQDSNCLKACSALGMVSYWRGESNTDDSVGGNNGISNNTTFTSGQVGQAFDFSSNGDVSVSKTDNLVLGQTGTISVWVNPASGYTSGYRSILQGDWYGNSYVLQTNINNGYIIIWWAGTMFTSNYAAPINTWTHITSTYDGSVVKIYANGQEIFSQAKTGIISSPDTTLYIGNDTYPGTYNWIGAIDELAVFNRALTSTEVQDLYDNSSNNNYYCKF